MATLTSSDILHVAKLSNLKLKKSEVVKFKNQLTKVVNFISELNDVDTTDVEPTSQTTGLTNISRKDEIDAVSILPPDDALSGTDSIYNGFFKVPMILKNKI